MGIAARIRAVRWVDKEPVATLIADTFYSTPLGTWLVPDTQQRRQVLTEVAAIWVEHAMFYGDIHLSDDLTAATVGFHRYRPIPLPANYGLRLADAAGAHAGRFHLLDSVLSAKQPTEPHYQLALLAVHPDTRQAERETAMLNHHRRRLDRINLPAWTVATTDSQDRYARHGYTPRPAVALPEGPIMCPMRRNPHRDGDT
ncbi:N-acetyltransferase [Micromonospora musae]|uniref:N-acetyltransferase n=1 Tax=Micromonospora musae TaxID=1894970 RepID=UPI003441E008